MTTPERSVEEIVKAVMGYVPNDLIGRDVMEEELTQTLQAERQKREEMVEAERERMIRWVNENTKEFVPADSEWFGDDDSMVGEHKLVPAKDPEEAMYCLNCEGFLHEEGCSCNYVYKEDLLQALTNPNNPN